MTSQLGTHPTVIATHNGAFHADDCCGVAVLQTLYPRNTVVRTRDMAVIEQADFAVDVGGVWDDENGRYDHHQKGFSGARPTGVVYASAGLIWSSFGSQYAHELVPGLSQSEAQAVKDSVDLDFIQYLDMADTGAAKSAPGLFGFSALISQLVPNWDAEQGLTPEQGSALRLERFQQAVTLTGEFLSAIVRSKVAQVRAAEIVRGSSRLYDGRVLLISAGGMPWTKIVCNEMPDVLFVVYPDSADSQFQVRTVPLEKESFVARKDLPAPWAGLRDADLAQVSGVADAVFCHNGRFIGGARSLEGALHMTRLALASE